MDCNTSSKGPAFPQGANLFAITRRNNENVVIYQEAAYATILRLGYEFTTEDGRVYAGTESGLECSMTAQCLWEKKDGKRDWNILLNLFDTDGIRLFSWRDTLIRGKLIVIAALHRDSSPSASNLPELFGHVLLFDYDSNGQRSSCDFGSGDIISHWLLDCELMQHRINQPSASIPLL